MNDLLLSRARPDCLDIPWAAGTGLIWKKGETLFYENPRNRFMRFRKVFSPDRPVRRAELRIFADTHYCSQNSQRWIKGPPSIKYCHGTTHCGEDSDLDRGVR